MKSLLCIARQPAALKTADMQHFRSPVNLAVSYFADVKARLRTSLSLSLVVSYPLSSFSGHHVYTTLKSVWRLRICASHSVTRDDNQHIFKCTITEIGSFEFSSSLSLYLPRDMLHKRNTQYCPSVLTTVTSV